jgi:putative ABC transport system ATP-binding protein
MLKAKNIVFNYPSSKQVFRFPDVEVQPDKTCVITGASGSGKTTLMHLLGGILSPAEGSVLLNETEISHLKSKERDAFRGEHISLIFQDDRFFPDLSILDQMKLHLWFGKRVKADENELIKMAETLHMHDYLYKSPSQLSKGQRQRAAVLLALAKKPKFILADEPTSNLDETNALAQCDLLIHAAAQLHAVLIVITHDMRIVHRFTQNIQVA